MPSTPVLASIEATVVAMLALLSLAAYNAGPLPGDEWLTARAQDLPASLELAAETLRAVTGTRVVLILGALLAVFLWFTGRRRQAVALAVGLVVLPFAQAGLKELVDRPRPDPSLVDRRAGFTSESFPSGHVMSGTLLLGFGAWLMWGTGSHWSRAVAAGLAVLALMNGVANVYEGVHWPTDVLGGYLGALALLAPVLWWAQHEAADTG